MNIKFVYFLDKKLPEKTETYGTVPKYKTLHKSEQTNTSQTKAILKVLRKILLMITYF